jgi:TPR repeat protein
MSVRLLQSLSLAALLAAGAPASFAADAPAPPKSETEWKTYFRDLARSKDAQSFFLMGTYYAAGHPHLGRGKPDHAEAFRYYQRAAELNHPEAQYRLGYCYEKKLGVRLASLELAHKWYLRAADQELPVAQLRVGEMYMNKEGVQFNDKLAFQYLYKAAERGLPDAQRMIGDCYKIGWGPGRDNVKALTWYIIAAHQENEKAIVNRDNLAASMPNHEKLMAEKAAKEFRSKP